MLDTALSVLDYGLRAANIVLQTNEVIETIKTEHSSSARKADACFQVGLLTLQLLQAVSSSNSDINSQKRLQQLDLALRVANLPVKWRIGTQENDPTQKKVGIISILRSRTDLALLTKTGEDAQRYKALEVAMLSIENFWLLNSSRIPATNPSQHAIQPQQGNDNLDLVKWDVIPIELEEDRVLSLHICPINKTAIRYPMREKTLSQQIYEKDAIQNWVQKNGNSPVTRRAITLNDLEDCPDIQALIDKRLAQVSRNINKLIERMQQPTNH